MNIRLLILLAVASFAMHMQAVEITRYVSTSGTGDGMTPENPTSDLNSVLYMSFKVDALTIFIEPGTYSIDVDLETGTTFPNVVFDGIWRQEGEEIVFIDSWIAFSNSSVRNLYTSGRLSISGGNLYGCASDAEIFADCNGGDVILYDCVARSFSAENWKYGNKPSLYLQGCQAVGGGGYGLYAKGIHDLYCVNCLFADHEEGGIHIDNCMESTFTYCDIDNNSGYGAARVTCFDNAAVINFDRCQFLNNSVKYNNSHNLLITCNAFFNDCLFVGNTEKSYDSRGFIHLSVPDFYFDNCTFIDNSGVIEAEMLSPDKSVIRNCAFWKNGKDMVYCASGGDMLYDHCATDQGTGIPELDAEIGLIILTDNNKGFTWELEEYYGYIKMDPSSVLVNNGVSRGLKAKDLYNRWRTVFGATDIGCAEFAESEWEPTDKKISVHGVEFVLCKYASDGRDYYAAIGSNLIEDGVVNPLFTYGKSNWIYLDTMPVEPKVHDGKYIERTTKTGQNEYTIDVYAFDLVYYWHVISSTTYTSAKDRPTVKIDGGEVKFIKPKVPVGSKAAPKKNTASNKQTSKSSLIKKF